jgi:hypothetical protein
MNLADLKEALGDKFVTKGDDEQVRVFDEKGFDVTFIDIATGSIEYEICARWHSTEGAEGPDAAGEAQSAINAQLKPEWEEAGFVVSESGSIGEFCYRNEPDKKLPVYKVEVTKIVENARDAAETVRWIQNADGEVWF